MKGQDLRMPTTLHIVRMDANEALLAGLPALTGGKDAEDITQPCPHSHIVAIDRDNRAMAALLERLKVPFDFLSYRRKMGLLRRMDITGMIRRTGAERVITYTLSDTIEAARDMPSRTALTPVLQPGEDGAAWPGRCTAPYRAHAAPYAAGDNPYETRLTPAPPPGPTPVPLDRSLAGVPGRAHLAGMIAHEVPPALFAPLAKAMKQHPEWYLVVAGGTQETLKALRRESSHHGLDAHIKFCGWSVPVPDFFAGLDLCLLPPESRYIPGITLYACKAGVPLLYPVNLAPHMPGTELAAGSRALDRIGQDSLDKTLKDYASALLVR